MQGRATALIGWDSPLARAAEAQLQGHSIRVFRLSLEALRSAFPAHVDRALWFPFPPFCRFSKRHEWKQEVEVLERFLASPEGRGLKRFVLRSKTTAYGNSWKNYGLMEEDRPPLVPENSRTMRWLEAERVVRQWQPQEPDASRAILRLAPILDPGEGDFLTHQLAARVSTPLSGHDPMAQFLTLQDAARALVVAAESESAGIFNVSTRDAVSFRDALKAASPLRLPGPGLVQKPLRQVGWRLGVSRFPAESTEQIRYNFTVSPERAARELGFEPHHGSLEALRKFLAPRGREAARINLCESYDEFGLDPGYLEFWNPWFSFLRKAYWRVEVEGLENIPRREKAILLPNHRGFMPFDGVMHRVTIFAEVGRQVRFLVIPSLFKFPFLSDFLIKQGGVVASQQNAARLFARKELVGLFPEGINGAFRMARGAYRLGSMGRNAFARLAIEHQTPIIPAATVGHVEIFPIFFRVRSRWIKKTTGWPFLPVTPTFPVLPLPLPTKWHIRYLEPISPSSLRPEDAENKKKVGEFGQHVKHVLQQNIDEMLERRKHIFFGNIFERRKGPESG